MTLLNSNWHTQCCQTYLVLVLINDIFASLATLRNLLTAAGITEIQQHCAVCVVIKPIGNCFSQLLVINISFNMSVPFSGALRRSGGIVSAIGKQLKGINLKGVKRITVQFDPFAENVKSTR